MSDQTIDAIKVRLGVDAKGVASDVQAANKEFTKLGGGKKSVSLTVNPVLGGGSAAVNKFVAQIKELKKMGPLKVPISVALGSHDAAQVRASIRKNVGTVKIDFDWVAQSAPKYTGKVKVDWEWGEGPNGSPGGPPSGGGGGGHTGPQTGPSGAGAGRQEGETRAQASARHKADNAAAQAEARAAREREKAARDAEKRARDTQQAQRTATSQGASSTTPGPVGDQTRRVERTAEKAKQDAAAATTRAARSQRQQELDQERSVLLKQRKEHAAKLADIRTPVRKRQYEQIVADDDRDLAKNAAERKVEAKRLREERAAAPVTPKAGAPISGVGHRGPKPKPAEGAPTTGGTTGQTTATAVPTAAVPFAVPFGGATSLDSLRGGKKVRGRPGARGFGPGPRGFGPDAESLPGEMGPEGARIREARLGRLRRALEERAQGEHKAALKKAVDPRIGGEMFDTGDLDAMLPGLQEIFAEKDPAQKAALFKDFQLKHSGRGGLDRFGNVISADPKLKKRNRKLFRRGVLDNVNDLEFLAGVFGGEAGFEARAAFDPGTANRTSADSGGGIAAPPVRPEKGVHRLVKPTVTAVKKSVPPTFTDEELRSAERWDRVKPAMRAISGQEPTGPATRHPGPIRIVATGFEGTFQGIDEKDKTAPPPVHFAPKVRTGTRPRKPIEYVGGPALAAYGGSMLFADRPRKSARVERPESFDIDEAAAKLGEKFNVIREMGEGGLYSRQIGHQWGGGGERSLASLRDPAWEKRRTAHLAENRFCAHCGQPASEASRQRKKGGKRARLTVDTLQSAAEARSLGLPDPHIAGALQTLCPSCQSSKNAFSTQPAALWTHPRPHGLANNPRLKAKRTDFLAGGRFFGVTSLGQALSRIKGLAEGGEGLRGFRSGGEVRHTGLLDRLAARGHYPDVTMLGERGPELAVSDPNTGQTEIVPTHKVSAWLARAREGHGVAKDLTGMAPGGATRMRFPAGTPGGLGGQFVSPNPVNAFLAGAGGIQQVAVTNWPAALTAAVGNPAGFAAGPIQPNQPPPGGPQLGGPAIAQVLNQAQARAASQPKPPAITAETKMLAKLQGRASAEQLSDRLGAVRSQITEATSLVPVRALSVTFGQVMANTLGGRQDIIARGARTGRLAARAQRALGVEQQAEVAVGETVGRRRELRAGRPVSALSPDEKLQNDALTATIRDQVKARRLASVEAEKAVEKAEKSAKGILTLKSAVRSLTAGLIGVTGGTLAFSAAFTAANAVIGAVADGVANAAERVTGYRDTAAKMNQTLADQTKAANGNAQAVTAQAVAQSGLSDAVAATVQPLLKQRAATMEGNQNLQSQVELMANAQQIAGERPAGLPAGYDTNLVKSVGGAFNLGIGPGSQMPTAQIIENALGGPASSTGTSVPSRASVIAQPAQNLVGYAYGAGGAAGTPAAKAVDASTEALKEFNIKAKEGGSSLALLSATGKDADAQIAATAKALRDIHADQLAGNVEKNRLAFTGGDVNQFGAAEWLDAIQQASQRPSANQALDATIAQLPTQIRAIQRTGAFEREQAIPANVAVQYAARPLIGFNDPRLRPNQNVLSTPGSGEGFKAQQSEYDASFAKYAPMALKAQQAITAEVDKGDKVLKDWGVPDDMIAGLKTVGAAIQGIQLGIDQRGLNLEVAQYNNELRIANRSLGDAQDMYAGIKGSVKDTLGGLEGQNISLGRQLQLLEQELAQKQINFKLAIAGFQAPGLTSEERAARQEQARIEADYAQKQLDIQKQMTSGQFQVTTIGAQRSVTDLEAQISLLSKSRSLTIDTYSASKAIETLNQQEDIMLAKVQSLVNEGQTVAKTMIDAISAAETASLKFITDVSPAFQKVFTDAGYNFGRAFQLAINPSLASGGGSTGGGGGRATAMRSAPGYIGYHSTPTQMTVGEAAGEQVYVLRNPRNMTMDMGGGGGGGPTSVVVNMGGITIQGDVKDEAIIAKIVRAVEDSFNRKAARLGMRSLVSANG